MPLRVTTWNLEHSDRLVTPTPGDHVLERRRRIRETVESINPDILCIQEGPKGEQAIDDFCKQVLNQAYLPVLLRQEGEALGERDSEYKTGGSQWIWFLVKTGLADRCRLQSPAAWQEFTGGRSWKLNYWGIEKPSSHSHFRHPQVLIYQVDDDHDIELIGVHLKSKINLKKIEFDDGGNIIGDYLAEALEARVKLASEARNVRDYIQAKFNQLEHPGIAVMGDCNDGPGQDHFESQYLFFDLVGNLQGEVIVAERFFNHALFDYSGDLRWTARYDDKITGKKARDNPLLIDHLLISQPLCRGSLPLVVNAHAGKVEHEAYERNNVGANTKTTTSDHRPVTCNFDDT